MAELVVVVLVLTPRSSQGGSRSRHGWIQNRNQDAFPSSLFGSCSGGRAGRHLGSSIRLSPAEGLAGTGSFWCAGMTNFPPLLPRKFSNPSGADPRIHCLEDDRGEKKCAHTLSPCYVGCCRRLHSLRFVSLSLVSCYCIP